MRCERAQELFSEYYEGSIQTALTVPLEGHLRECASCRGEYEGLRYVWPVLDAAPSIDPPDNFRALVWQRIEADEARRATERKPVFSLDWRSLFPRPALGWAAAVLAVIVLSGVVVPGVYTPARLFFPWTVSGPRVASAAVEVSPAQVFAEANGQAVKVHVVNPGPTPVRIDVNLESGSMDQRHNSFIAPAGANGWFVIGMVRPEDPRPVKVSTISHPVD